jgi:hypothetical protein
MNEITLPVKQPGYKTSDGEFHTDEGEALKQEFMIQVRGAIQSRMGAPVRTTITTTEVAHVITHNPTLFVDLIKFFTRKLAAFDRKTGVSFNPKNLTTTKKGV